MRSHHGMTVERGDDEPNESDDDKTIGSDDGDDREADPDDEGDGSESDDAEDAQWTIIVSKACGNVSFGPAFEKPTDALKEPFLSEIVSEMANFVERRLLFANLIENSNEAYEKINDRIERFESEGMPRDEAANTAWHDRRFLLRKILAEHLDVVKEKLLPEYESSDDNEELD